MTNPRFSVQPQAGQQMPPNWQAKAKDRARLAEADYLWRLENGWKGSDANGSSGNLMRDSRLKPPSWEDIIGQK